MWLKATRTQVTNSVHLLFGYSEDFGLHSEGCLGGFSFPRTPYHTGDGGSIYSCLFTDQIHSLPRLAGGHKLWFLFKWWDHGPTLPKSHEVICLSWSCGDTCIHCYLGLLGACDACLLATALAHVATEFLALPQSGWHGTCGKERDGVNFWVTMYDILKSVCS